MTIGAGRELKRLLRVFSLIPIISCNCDYYADLMDEKGTTWCSKNVETIVGYMEEEAKKRGLPFVRIAGRILVRKAIRNAKRKAKFLE